MVPYIKTFKGKSPTYVKREAEFLQIAASHGLAPEIYDTDYRTYIEMENLKCMNIGDMWGNDIREIPKDILAGMFSILWFLYHICEIEYRDVWPRNFIFVNKRVYIIDFGDARKKQKICDKYLSKILKAGRITHWNPEFR